MEFAFRASEVKYNSFRQMLDVNGSWGKISRSIPAKHISGALAYATVQCVHSFTLQPQRRRELLRPFIRIRIERTFDSWQKKRWDMSRRIEANIRSPCVVPDKCDERWTTERHLVVLLLLHPHAAIASPRRERRKQINSIFCMRLHSIHSFSFFSLRVIHRHRGCRYYRWWEERFFISSAAQLRLLIVAGYMKCVPEWSMNGVCFCVWCGVAKNIRFDLYEVCVTHMRFITIALSFSPHHFFLCAFARTLSTHARHIKYE